VPPQLQRQSRRSQRPMYGVRRTSSQRVHRSRRAVQALLQLQREPREVWRQALQVQRTLHTLQRPPSELQRVPSLRGLHPSESRRWVTFKGAAFLKGRAWVAKHGQRRQTQNLFSQESPGSNPGPRIPLLGRIPALGSRAIDW